MQEARQKVSRNESLVRKESQRKNRRAEEKVGEAPAEYNIGIVKTPAKSHEDQQKPSTIADEWIFCPGSQSD